MIVIDCHAYPYSQESVAGDSGVTVTSNEPHIV